jgi:hypothetical protein
VVLVVCKESTTLNYKKLDSPSAGRHERQIPQLRGLFALLAIIFAFVAPKLASAQNPVTLWQYSPISSVSSSAYSPDGSLLAVAGISGLQICRVSDGALIRCLPTINVISVSAVAFSPDGSTLYDAGQATDGYWVESWSTSAWTLKNQQPATIQRPNNIFENPYAIAISPDGTKIAVCGELQTVNEQNLGNGFLDIRSTADLSLLSELPIDPSTMTLYDVQFSPDGTKLAASGAKFGDFVGTAGSVQMFNVKTGQRTLDATTKVQANTCVGFSPDGGTLADGGGGLNPYTTLYTGSLEVRNLTTGAVTPLPTSMNNPMSVSFSPNGASLLVGGQFANGAVTQARAEIWSLGTGTSTQVPTNANIQIKSVQYSANGQSFQLGGQSTGPAGSFGVEEIWNATALSLTESLNLGQINGAKPSPSSGATSLTYAPSGNYLTFSGVGAQGQATAGLLNAATGALAISFPTTGSSIGTTALSADGITFADGGYSGTNLQNGVFEIWNASTGTLIASLPTKASVINQLAFSPDGTMVAGGGLNPVNGIEIWNVSTKTLSLTLPTAGMVQSLAYSSDGKMLVDGGSEIAGVTQTGMIEIWNVSSGQRTALNTACSQITSVAISPDGTQVADAGQTPSGSYLVEIWNAQTGASINSVPIAIYVTSSLAFTPDGGTLYVATSGGLWVVGAGEGYFGYGNGLLGLLPTTHVCVSPDGQFVGVAGGSASQAQSYVGLLSNPLYSPYQIAGLTLNPTTVTGGSSVTGMVTISQPAPVGGFSVLISTSPTNPVSTPGNVLIPAGQTSTTFTVNSSPVSSQVVATIGAYNLNYVKLATLTVNPPVLSTISLKPGSVVGGNTATGTVTLNGPAPNTGVTVNLLSSSPYASVPNAVSIGGGLTSATFTVSTTGVSSATTASISAATGGTTGKVPLTITPASLTSVTVNPTAVVGGSESTGTVTLSGYAPTGGFTVALKALKPVAGVSFPDSVTIAAGSNSASFQVATKPVSTQESVTIVASAGGQTSSASLTIQVATLQYVSIQPNSFVGGQSSSGTVYMTGQVTKAVTIKLVSNSSVVSVPASVTIKAGNSYANFTVTSTGVKTVQYVTIAAKIGAQAVTGQVTVSPAYLDAVKVNPTTVAGGGDVTGTVYLVGNAPAGGYVVTLSSSASCALVPATVTIPQGKGSADFTVKTTPVSSVQSPTITAATGFQVSATLTVTPPVLKSISFSESSVTGGQSVTATVTLESAAPTGGATVSIATSSSDVVVPSSVAVPAGQTSVKFAAKTLATTQKQTVTLTATYVGVSKSASIAIEKP